MDQPTGSSEARMAWPIWKGSSSTSLPKQNCYRTYCKEAVILLGPSNQVAMDPSYGCDFRSCYSPLKLQIWHALLTVRATVAPEQLKLQILPCSALFPMPGHWSDICGFSQSQLYLWRKTQTTNFSKLPTRAQAFHLGISSGRRQTLSQKSFMVNIIA